jgi:hypothetical protein
MDGCHEYNLPYETDGSRFDWVSPQVAHVTCADDSTSIQLFPQSIFKLSSYAVTFIVGYHAEEIRHKEKRQRKSTKCVVGY